MFFKKFIVIITKLCKTEIKILSKLISGESNTDQKHYWENMSRQYFTLVKAIGSLYHNKLMFKNLKVANLLSSYNKKNFKVIENLLKTKPGHMFIYQ